MTNDDAAIHLQFKAHSRTFNLRLKRDLSTFSDNLVILDPHGSILNSSQADTAHIYSGHLVGKGKFSLYLAIIIIFLIN